MNQILSTQNINNNDNNYNKKNKKVKEKNKFKSNVPNNATKDMNSILRFFAIMLIIFGVLIAGNGVLALNNGGTSKNNSKQGSTNPQIMIEKNGDDKVLITVTDETDLDNITYKWNNEEEQMVQNVSGKYKQEKIEIPEGENVLLVRALNVDGGVKEETKKFEMLSAINIKMDISGNSIKIDLSGKDEIEKISYAWDDEEPKEVEVNDKKYSMEIEAIIGEHTLKIVATDINGVEKEKVQKVRGTTKPKLQITKGDDAYHIIAYDEIGLDRIEITTLKDGKVKKIKSDGKELVYDFPLSENDENYVEIVAINTNNVESNRLKAKWPRN